MSGQPEPKAGPQFFENDGLANLWYVGFVKEQPSDTLFELWRFDLTQAGLEGEPTHLTQSTGTKGKGTTTDSKDWLSGMMNNKDLIIIVIIIIALILVYYAYTRGYFQ